MKIKDPNTQYFGGFLTKVKRKAGAKPLPKGEKKIIIQLFVKEKYHERAKKELEVIVRKYNTM